MLQVTFLFVDFRCNLFMVIGVFNMYYKVKLCDVENLDFLLLRIGF